MKHFPIHHRNVPHTCGKCHVAQKPVARRFRQLEFTACTPCHADQHKGEFAARNKGDCAQCHTINGFTPTTFGLTAHATTSFTLEGKHAATPCSACHTAPRPRVSFAIANKACDSCHQNPHGTQFATEMAKNGCATCHTSFDWHQPHIDHSKWPLLGSHARTPCAACHGQQKVGAEPAAYRGIPRECEGCHDDVHAGQFKSPPAKTCATCHDPEAFKLASKFDHAKTSYPLDGKHATVACAKCHTTETLRNGATAVRYRLGYHQCKDCHANPHKEGP